MNRYRRQTIRQLAAERAARELDAAIDSEVAVRLGLDREESEEFDAEIRRIVARLRKRASA
ncbi:hypothetical protein [Streptomyces sp. NPDC056169]|uniref:hypothetical protein n=1 Tax=Streptomyces sp. NPDC056169 TaxID=3345734 RepID=UPI0035E1B4B8